MSATKNSALVAQPTTTAPLQVQMVPMPLWGANLRAVMTRGQWRQVREAMLDQHGLVCSACGRTVERSRDLKCHEEWVYLEESEPAVAWLWAVSMVCFHCHASGHPGALNAMIAEGTVTERARAETIAHFCKVNGVTRRQWDVQLRRAQKEFNRRTTRRWYIDYGPFSEWIYATYAEDPLNAGEWSYNFPRRWGDAPEAPVLGTVVAGLPDYPVDAYPESERGVAAMLWEEQKVEKRVARRKRALKRKREAEGGAQAAAKAARAAALQP